MSVLEIDKGRTTAVFHIPPTQIMSISTRWSPWSPLRSVPPNIHSVARALVHAYSYVDFERGLQSDLSDALVAAAITLFTWNLTFLLVYR